jgi:hypothetical protein
MKWIKKSKWRLLFLGGKKSRRKPLLTSKESVETALIGAAQSRVRVKSTGDLAMDYLKAAMKEALQTRQRESLAHKVHF